MPKYITKENIRLLTTIYLRDKFKIIKDLDFIEISDEIAIKK